MASVQLTRNGCELPLWMAVRLLPLLLAIGVQAVLGDEVVRDEVCQVSSLNPGHVGSSGELVSLGYPGNLSLASAKCHLTVTVCAACRITLTFTQIQFTPCSTQPDVRGKCIIGCDHLLVHEPDYPYETTRYILAQNQSASLSTLSRRLLLTVCLGAPSLASAGRFMLQYEVTEKLFTFTRTLNSTWGDLDSLTSPNFPRGYAQSNEIYTYIIQNEHNVGFIRLSFDDWNLANSSNITIYYQNQTSSSAGSSSVVFSGGHQRPFILSTQPVLLLQFRTGDHVGTRRRYMGFKAKYQFVDSDLWPERPYTVCGQYFTSSYGGQFSVTEAMCAGGRVDCLWVIMRPPDPCCNYHTHVALHINGITLQASDTLVVRGGNSSDSALIWQYDTGYTPSREFIQRDAFYVRLAASCVQARDFTATFTAFTYAVSGQCRYEEHYACGNEHCVHESLRCDAVDHCGDGSDEKGCTTSTPGDCASLSPCADGRGAYCPLQRCDHTQHCGDGSDEQGCWMSDVGWTTWAPPSGLNGFHWGWGTYVPIGLCALTLVIIMCIFISCCARRKRAMRMRRNRSRLTAIAPVPGHSVRQGSETQLNINVEIQHYPDAPPTYEEAIAVHTGYGVLNMGFANVECERFLAEPPPYTAMAAEPLPICRQTIRTSASLLARPLPPVMPLRSVTTTEAGTGTVTHVMTLRELANTVPRSTTEGGSSTATGATTHPISNPPTRRPSRGSNRRCSLTMETVQETLERNDMENPSSSMASEAVSGCASHPSTTTNQNHAPTCNESQGDHGDQVVPESSPFFGETESSSVAEASLDDEEHGAGHDVSCHHSTILNCDRMHSDQDTVVPGSKQNTNSECTISELDITPAAKESGPVDIKGATSLQSISKSIDTCHNNTDPDSLASRVNHSKSSDDSSSTVAQDRVHLSAGSTFV